MANAPPAADTQQQPSGWLGGWFSRNPVPADQSAGARDAPIVSSQSEPAPDPPTQVATASTSEVESPPITSSQQPAASWFNIFWSAKTEPEGCSEESTKAAEASTQPAPEDASVEGPVLSDPEPASKPSAGSTWAFWSRDAPKSPGQQPPGPETGELAVVGDRSERRPLRANSKDMGGDEQLKEEPSRGQSIKAKQSKDKLSKKTKKTKPQSLDLNKTPSRPVTPQSDATSTKIESPSKGKTKTPTTATKSAPPNLLLPSFKDTYRMKESPSILKQITALLLRAQQAPAKHVFLKNEAPRIRKAIAIGVHGLFPATFLRPMIGQPTGTSIKFANHCAEGIRRWAESHGCGDCEIEKVALEGEGKIEARVQNLWTLLQNWMDHIRQADLVVIACHSQGVPVSMMLLEKLVDSGAIGNAKVGVCAMAGVSLGPFAEYKSSMGILMGTAAELWEFANSESEVSRRYEAALKKTLEYGVRITYVGSIDDQLSAIYSPASHPYIYRAVFIDGRLHASDFITHLVGFACKLRNMGVSDHGLIRELSIPLAGSLYGGEGHSRLYDDDQVYDLAISHTLETTDAGSVPCEIARYEGLAQPNPYVLPWIMRGLLEEDFVKTELSTETDQLLKRFDDWKPTTKPLQNVKYRLEAVRSRL
ncbi:hypothetical protein M406DRAFT_248705 [Cryphonectria parasitica EP155]|uniref:YMC020W-like alpha/beta hydrolase domain-containing protein n=1 Tax=Cryphonectria parasitica (strain ATCC 38755 / EP155) TaxID=660469 RepID=A0A9P4Y9S9_CRYP1|nr:uncharacterized protein M406DRAFT_248705 [Cryphonectria parasitica EP155]KAF3769582.1 hypothetical protein M406DRAFT_248705 [Cryphonectria parasitica EP155]